MRNCTQLTAESDLAEYRKICEKYGKVCVPELKSNFTLDEIREPEAFEQLDLFSDPAETTREKEKEEKERRLQETMLELRQKYGKNTVLKGTSYREGATARDRNRQIGGHKA